MDHTLQKLDFQKTISWILKKFYPFPSKQEYTWSHGGVMPHGHFVKDWMSETVIAVSPETKAIEALYLLKSHSIRFLPVLLGTKLLGVIAEKDLIHPVKSLKNLDVAKMYPMQLQYQILFAKLPITSALICGKKKSV